MSQKGSLFTRLNSWFSVLRRRERIMVLFAVFLVPLYLFAQLLYLPGQKQQKNFHRRYLGTQQENETLQRQLDEVDAALRTDPNEKNRKQLLQLTQELTQFDRSLQLDLAGLVPPQQMAELLRGMLCKRPGLTLLALKNISPQPFVTLEDSAFECAEHDNDVEKKQPDLAAPATPMLYRHGMQVTFTGSYLDTLKYLRGLQSLSQRLFWHGVSVEMTDIYPHAQVTMNVYTLSFQKGWIGG